MEGWLSNENYVDVYRVEKRGIGPYRDEDSGNCMYSKHPTPQHDAGLPKMYDLEIRPYRFGCPTSEVMKKWIRDPSELTKKGYKVSLYKAKKKYVYASTIQSMFIKRHAKKVKEWTVEEFMKDSI